MRARYGDLHHVMMLGLDAMKNKKSSAWWKDINSSSMLKTNFDCFAGCISFKLGEGRRNFLAQQVVRGGSSQKQLANFV